MATNLYEILALSQDATPEQIRRAYKKKALLTHPDRLPQGSTPEDKSASEEQFRLVNNAYEVLNDPQKRKEYDLHGVWPPPEPEEESPRRPNGARQRTHSHPHHHHHYAPHSPMFSDPFFHGPYMSFGFTDPRTIFESVFGPSFVYRPSHHHHHRSRMSEDPFDRAQRNMDRANRVELDMFSGLGGGFFNLYRPSVDSFFSLDSSPFPSSSSGSRGRWAGESFMTTSVNGVSQSIRKRRDWDGNEHVTHTYPDGREVHTINGVEQGPSARGYLPSRPGPVESRHVPPPPIVGQPHISSSRSDYVMPPPPPYPGTYSGPRSESDYGRHYEQRFSDTRPVIPEPYGTDTNPDFRRHEDRHERKRRWRGTR